jgi:1-deoxy-D-xylulose-5-phosphate reductoisomerase
MSRSDRGIFGGFMTEVISILGSTGSIGKQSIEVIRNLGNIKIEGLSAYSNIKLLEDQIREFKPKIACVADCKKAKELKSNIIDTDTKVVSGLDGLSEIATIQGVDTVLNSVVGTVGIIPTIDAINNKKNIALANKETLVAAGEIITKMARKKGVKIIPVDSEHSAIFQCLMGVKRKKDIAKIILTASGGPFWNKTKEELINIKPADALRHPNWSMGQKITIDSATLMNKGLELIEAYWLFGIDIERIEIVVHRQSVVHSMVEMIDGSVMAQLGFPDMRIPIQFSLTYPDRIGNHFSRYNFSKDHQLNFCSPDYESFECLNLAKDAILENGTMPVVMNAANEAAVDMFLKQKVAFLDIPRIIRGVMRKHKKVMSPSIEEILNADKWAREEVKIWSF